MVIDKISIFAPELKTQPMQLNDSVKSLSQDKNTLFYILLGGAILRLLTAFFSPGYAYHDDLFDIVLPAQNWIFDLPMWMDPHNPPKHTMLYVGANYFLFNFLHQMGLHTPESKMLIERILHGIYSLLVIMLGYKITLRLAPRSQALLVAAIFAFTWFFPFLAVRNLVEMVCLPFLLGGFYLIIKYRQTDNISAAQYLLAGGLLGIAFAIRYHTVLFTGGAALVLLLQKEWRPFIYLSFGYLLSAFLGVGIIDLVFYEYPFHSIVWYATYNLDNPGLSAEPFYHYIVMFIMFVVPPAGIFIIAGYFKSWKLTPYLFASVIPFFIFHSIFPHKQERFIIPMIPLAVIAGVVGWHHLMKKSSFLQRHRSLIVYAWIFYFALNIVVSLVFAFSPLKKGRIEAMKYLREKEDLRAIIYENDNRYGPKPPPEFYLNRPSARFYEFDSDANYTWHKIKADKSYLDEDFVIIFSKGFEKSYDQLKEEIRSVEKRPNYVVFRGDENLDERMKNIEREFGVELRLEREIHPSMYDRITTTIKEMHYPDEHTFVYRMIPVR